MEVEIEIRLYRAVAKWPPRGKDYLSAAGRGRTLPDHATEQERRSWDALSAWDTAEGALNAAKGILSAKWIARYDIPVGHGLTYAPSPPPGHYDIWGDSEELHRCLAPGFRMEVVRKTAMEE